MGATWSYNCNIRTTHKEFYQLELSPGCELAASQAMSLWRKHLRSHTCKHLPQRYVKINHVTVYNTITYHAGHLKVGCWTNGRHDPGRQEHRDFLSQAT